MKSFTLLELIIAIVIIGILAAVAIPNFSHLSTHSKDAAVKSVITTIQSSIDNIHSEWIVNDSYEWKPESGDCKLNDEGYPNKLDDNSSSEKKLFKCVLKNPIIACGDKKSGCFVESSGGVYDYYYSPKKYLRVEYNSTNGKLECKDGGEINSTKCEEILFR